MHFLSRPLLPLIIATASLDIASFCSAQVDLGELSANPYGQHGSPSGPYAAITR